MDAIAKELEQVRLKAGGILKCEDIVAFAKDKSTALHSRFEWSNSKAAHEYRLWQAREVIRVTVITFPNDNRPVRAYVSIAEDRKEAGGGYRPMNMVMTNPVYRESLLATALKDFRYFESKYHHLEELAPLFEAAQEVKKSAV